MGDAAGEGMLHDRKADQHDDEDKPAKQRGPDDVVGEKAEDRHRGAEHPHHQEKPGRDQHHRAVIAVGGKIDDEPETEHGDEEQRYARDSGGDRRGEQRDRHERAEEGEPADGDVRVAHVPAVEVEIGEQEHQQRRRKDRFARRAPDALGAGGHVEHFRPEAEVDADIDQHRPAERRRGREHHAALDHEQDGQKQRQQSGNADDDALIERERIDLVLVGVGLPQIELRQIVGAQFGDEGNHCAGIKRDAENIRIGIVLPLGRIAGGRRDVDDARKAKIGPKQARADHPIMRRHDQPIDLLVAVIGEREDGPVCARLAGAHLDAADDAVGAGRGRNLDAVAVATLELDGVGEVDGSGVGADVDGLDRMRSGEPREGCERDRQNGAQKCQEATSDVGSRRRWRRDDQHSSESIPNRLCAEFAAPRR